MPIGQEVEEIQQFDWWRVRVQPLGLHTSAQSSKVKGLHNAYMATLVGTFGAKSLDSWQEFWHIENRNRN